MIVVAGIKIRSRTREKIVQLTDTIFGLMKTGFSFPAYPKGVLLMGILPDICTMKYILSLLLTMSMITAFSQRKELVLATYTYSSNNRLANLQPLAQWLSAKTGITFIARSYPTVKALQQALLSDSVDLAMMNTSGYMVLQRNHPGIAIPLVNLSLGNASATQYGGCIIAAKQNGWQDISSLTKQSDLSVALVSPSSTSGNLVPRLLFNEAGIPELEKKGSVYYSGTHKQVVEDVLSGKAMIGGCGCAEIDSARRKLTFDEKAIVLASFNDIPLGPVVCRRSMPETVRKEVEYLFRMLHREAPTVFTDFLPGWTEFRQATHFQAVNDAHYDGFRKMFGNNELLWKMIE